MLNLIAYGTDQLKRVIEILSTSTIFSEKYTVKYYDSSKYLQVEIPKDFWTNIEVADVFVYQPLSTKFKTHSTEYIKTKLKKDCVKIGFPFMFNTGVNALSFILPEEKVCGYEYIIKYLNEGISQQQVNNLLKNNCINFDLKNRFNKCIEQMKFNEYNLDIKVTPYILDHISTEKIFLSVFFVSDNILLDISKKILISLSIEPSLILKETSIEIPSCLRLITSPYEKEAFNLTYNIDNLWYGLYCQFIDIIYKRKNSFVITSDILPNYEYLENFDNYGMKQISKYDNFDNIETYLMFNKAHNKYSQFGEEIIAEYLFKYLPIKHKYCVEFGGGDGVEYSNTKRLRDQGWKHLLMDGNARSPEIKQEFITKENIIDLFVKYDVPNDFDFLSVDIDGNDFYVCDKILEKYHPTLIVIESNIFFDSNISKVIPYDEKWQWKGDMYFGASVLAMEKMFAKHHYVCIYLNMVNLFAVSAEYYYLIRQHIVEFNPEKISSSEFYTLYIKPKIIPEKMTKFLEY